MSLADLVHPEAHAIRDAVAFAIEHGDNCVVEDGYAERNGWPSDDWLSDWGAFMSDHVLKELYARGYMVVRRAGFVTEINPNPDLPK